MLQLSTVETSTLELLKKLMCFDEFAKMRLVGGTALALQIGHRKSIYLDFYMRKYFDGSEYLVLKSLTYFGDAENDIDVKMMKDVSWSKIKANILEAVNQY